MVEYHYNLWYLILENSTSPEDTDDISLFHLLESGGRINELPKSFLKQLQSPSSNESSESHKSFTSSSPPKPPTDTSSADVTRLLDRLRALEAEVESSADQLKASNNEFLQLRERLTTAAVEKAHLKASLDSLDDQVMRSSV